MVKKNNNTDSVLTARSLKPLGNSTDVAEPRGWTESSSDWDAPPADFNGQALPARALLKATDLVVSYGSKYALRGISFNLYQGDTLGLLGLNGAGKSTLLNVLAGALAPDTGSVYIDDRELYLHTIASRMALGYAPDKPAVYPEFRVIEFLRFIARMRRIESASADAAIDRVVERCGLGDVRRRIIGNLSSGYQQRVNLAQALIHDPRVLILDEPANGLDPVQLIEMRELISSLTREQATIFSSHLLSEVDSVCNRIVLIHGGEQLIDTSLDSFSDPKYQSFELHLHKQHNEVDLKNLPGVTQACSITPHRWCVAGDALTAQHLTTMLHSRGVQVEKITPADNFIQSLFQQLSRAGQSDDQSLQK